jgi:hypothetical protein
MPSTITAANHAVDWQITSAGSSSFSPRAFRINLLAGYTGDSTTIVQIMTNSAAGTSTLDPFSVSSPAGNRGFQASASATTVGTNIGGLNQARNSSTTNIGSFNYVDITGANATNYGVIGNVIVATSGTSKNIGVAGIALNGSVTIGGYFGLQNAIPTFTSAALMCDNGSTTSDIFAARDNGTITFNIIDGGNVGIFQRTPTSRLQLNYDQNSVSTADSNGFLLANATGATNGTQSISPPFIQQGNGWGTTGSASQDVRFRQNVLPVQGTTPTGTWQLAASINGGAYSNVLTVTSAGNASIAGTLAVTGNATFSGDVIKGNFRVGGNNAYHLSQMLVGLADTSSQAYRTTNGGSDINTKLLCVFNGSNSTAGTLGMILDATAGMLFTAANGTRVIARAAITIGNLTNTAGSEAADMLFHTQNAGAAYTQQMRISKAGNVVLGNEAALSTSATDGFTYIPTCAGAPSGTPTSYTGKVAMIYDTTNNKLYAYNGAWKSVTLA